MPDTWGIITVEQDERDESKLDFYVMRRPERNTRRDILKKISLLWRPELAHILAAEKLPKYSGKNKKYVTKVLVDKIPEGKLDRMISEELFERDYTRFED